MGLINLQSYGGKANTKRAYKAWVNGNLDELKR